MKLIYGNVFQKWSKNNRSSFLVQVFNGIIVSYHLSWVSKVCFLPSGNFFTKFFFHAPFWIYNQFEGGKNLFRYTITHKLVQKVFKNLKLSSLNFTFYMKTFSFRNVYKSIFTQFLSLSDNLGIYHIICRQIFYYFIYAFVVLRSFEPKKWAGKFNLSRQLLSHP